MYEHKDADQVAAILKSMQDSGASSLDLLNVATELSEGKTQRQAALFKALVNPDD